MKKGKKEREGSKKIGSNETSFGKGMSEVLGSKRKGSYKT